MSKGTYKVVQNFRKSQKSDRKAYYLMNVHEEVLSELGKKAKTKQFRNNLCKINCIVCKGPEPYPDGNDGFYIIRAYSDRWSYDIKDYFPIIISDKMLDINAIKEGKELEVIGKLGSWPANKFYLVVYATKCSFLQDGTVQRDMNRKSFVYIQGCIRQPAIYSVINSKEAAVMVVELFDENGKKEYIPCLAWCKDARMVRKILPSDKVKIYGNLQSYSKVKGVRKKRYICVENIDLI